MPTMNRGEKGGSEIANFHLAPIACGEFLTEIAHLLKQLRWFGCEEEKKRKRKKKRPENVCLWSSETSQLQPDLQTKGNLL